MANPLLGFDPIPENATIDLGKVRHGAEHPREHDAADRGERRLRAFDGTYTHTENAVPYTLCSDNGTGTITTCPLTIGARHVLVVTPYSGANLADATASPSTTLYFFTVVDTADGGADAAHD